MDLLQAGAIKDVTHTNASSNWLYAPSTTILEEAQHDNADDNILKCCCYRHMGDIELQFLLQTHQLPDTQPYQTLTRNEEGRRYCEMYLRSNKYVDTCPTTVVEFLCPKALIDDLYRIQSKIEDGTMSHGLGNKAGKTLSRFNEALARGEITWRLVLIKRSGA